jgi:DnaK suppressor protein
MTQIELDRYRARLQDKLAELTNGSRGRGVLAAEPTADEMDQTQGVQERDMAVGGFNRDAKLLSDLRSALNRIQRGTFGTCVDCECDISPKRLAAVPWAESCIVCQEAAETRPFESRGESGGESGRALESSALENAA